MIDLQISFFFQRKKNIKQQDKQNRDNINKYHPLFTIDHLEGY